jgi:hypothetical protein
MRQVGTTRRRRLPRVTVPTAMVATVAAVLFVAPSAFAVGGAAFTTDNPAVDGIGHCQNGPSGATTPAINCNIYDGKEFVWLNGGPDKNQLKPDGYYFFAVLSPGGQPTPNDGTGAGADQGTPKNLSDDFDAYTNRTFLAEDGEAFFYSGTHWLDSGTECVPDDTVTPAITCPRARDNTPPYIRLAPYSNTLNQGGVYILAICYIGPNGDGYPVKPRDCKYDAFKVKAGDTTPPAADLLVDKDATPQFKRKFTWAIDKSVDKTLVRQIGGTATFNYTVKANPASSTDKDWKVTGTIDVFNPNNFAVPGVNITDQIFYDDDNDPNTDRVVDVTCDVTNGADQTISAHDTIHRGYTCTYTSAPKATDETNIVTATWPTTGDLVDTSGSSSFEKDFSWPSSPTELVDECINVTDAVDGGSAGALGQVCVNEDGNVLAPTNLGTGVTATRKPNSGPPFTSVEFTYSQTFAVPQFDCITHNNTAKFTTTDTGAYGTDSESVQVCGPAQTGALTIGFWKNTNGQNLVNTYCNRGSYNLGTYLQGLGAGSGPFANAPSGCASLKTYVFNILNGASATNMNVMLRAQMLATALDVWFSGPGWTSTKTGGIKPPSQFLSHNNLGTFNMITTAICPMVDSLSTGTATCKNNTPSTNAVSPGALPNSPMRMQAILDYAATSPAPFNGSTSSPAWYGGDRTKQEILKNVFDQFNNQDAFGSF